MFWRIRAVANVPIFRYVDNHFGEGIVGGPILSSEEIARRTAAVAARILSGETASDIKTPTVGMSAPTYDWRELQRWNISEAVLPQSSIVQFREPTAWQRYRVQILAIAAALLLQTLLIFWLFQEHRRRQIAEAESLRQVNEMARMNRFATAGELALSIAHEIRQPLAAVVFFASASLNWLKEQTPDLDEARTAMRKAMEQSHRADDVIKGVLAMFRKAAQERKLVDLHELVEQVLAFAAGAMKLNGVVLEAALTDGTPPIVMADPIQLQQVILNLVMNAVEAMRDSANGARTLQIHTETRADGTVLISVTDTGPIIDPQIVEKMFQPFFMTKPSGMGMGLAICRTIVEAHEGSLTGVPNSTHEMVFRIVLPLYQNP